MIKRSIVALPMNGLRRNDVEQHYKCSEQKTTSAAWHFKFFIWEPAVVLLLSFCCVTHLYGCTAIERVLSYEL